MENIYNSWIQFNKMQQRQFKGPLANLCLDNIDNLTKKWQTLPYPTGENWKYVKFDQLPVTNLAVPTAPRANTQIVEPDFYTIEIADFSSITEMKGNLNIQGLSVTTHREELENKQNSPLYDLLQNQAGDNPFAQSALSFAGLGLVVRLEKETVLDKPVKIIFDFDKINKKDVIAVFNLVFAIQPRSKSQFFIEFRGESLVGLSNVRVDARLGESSHTTFCCKEIGGAQSHFAFNLIAQLKKNAYLKTFDFTLPGLWSRHDLQMDLAETGAHVEMFGAYINRDKYFTDHHTNINHLVEGTFSKEDYRGVLADQARAVFNGRVYIAPFAKQSSSEQLNKNIMLSKKAEINTKPQLQIYNDDVKASHGATVGQIDKEQQFYLETRGYSQKEALKALAKAFVFDLFENEDQKLKDYYISSLLSVLASMEET